MVEALPGRLAYVGLKGPALSGHFRTEVTRWISSAAERWREMQAAYEAAKEALDGP